MILYRILYEIGYVLMTLKRRFNYHHVSLFLLKVMTLSLFLLEVMMINKYFLYMRYNSSMDLNKSF